MLSKIFLIGLLFVPAVLHANPIKKLDEGLYAGSAKAASSRVIYFGMEKIDAKNELEWRTYAELTEKFADRKTGAFYLSAISSDKPLSYNAAQNESLGFSKSEYESFLGDLKSANAYTKSRVEAIARLDGGTNGFLEKLKPGNWVVYASKNPIDARFSFNKLLTQDKDKVTFKIFRQAFEQLIMVMTVTEFADEPFTEHRGIFRNISDFLDAKNTFGGISLILHGFAAEVTRQMLPKKLYVEIDPTPFMSKLLMKSFSPEAMFMGTSKNRAFNKKFRPIIHEFENTVSIAKEDVDLDKYPKALPADKIQYLKRDGDGLIIGVFTHLIKINALASFFLKAQVE